MVNRAFVYAMYILAPDGILQSQMNVSNKHAALSALQQAVDCAPDMHVTGSISFLMGVCLFTEFHRDSTILSKCKKIFIESIKDPQSLTLSFLALRYLYFVSIDCEEYAMASKLLYQFGLYEDFSLISSGFIRTTPETERSYDQMSLSRNLACMKCECCGKLEVESKLRACTGCMLAMYCGKRCQKSHWNTYHRSKCRRNWMNYYKEMKLHCFSLLKQALNFGKLSKISDGCPADPVDEADLFELNDSNCTLSKIVDDN